MEQPEHGKQLTVLNGDRASAVAVLLLGLYLVYEALHLKFGSITRPGPGFYPAVLAVLLVGVSGALILHALRSKKEILTVSFGARTGYIGITGVAIALYAAVLEALGFLVCTFVLVVALLIGIGKVPWPRSLLVAAIGTVSVYAVFTQLGIPLPKGIAGF
jgi:putative tricarboxylic transport membrane protein